MGNAQKFVTARKEVAYPGGNVAQELCFGVEDTP